MKRIEVTDDMKPLVRFLIVGRNTDLEAQLLVKSRQPHILANTPNDAHKRFGDEGMLRHWLTKGRLIHWLVGPDNDLAGIMWYGREALPVDVSLLEIPQETFAIRLYEGYIGHHLSLPFMRLSFSTYIEGKQARGEAINGLWLQTDASNQAGYAAYAKFGFQEIYRDNDRITMVMDSEQILKICHASSE